MKKYNQNQTEWKSNQIVAMLKIISQSIKLISIIYITGREKSNSCTSMYEL